MSNSMNGMPGMSGVPGAGAINDTLEFVRNFWGAMKIPGMSMPSMSPDDINKQIADLKAVESWLQMNMNMLRSTIQTLEVQSATLTALQAMSDSFARASTPSASHGSNDKPPFESPFARAAEPPAADGSADAAAMAAQFANPAAWWNTVQEQFSQAVNTAMTPPKKSARKSAAGTRKRSASPRKPASKT